MGAGTRRRRAVTLRRGRGHTARLRRTAGPVLIATALAFVVPLGLSGGIPSARAASGGPTATVSAATHHDTSPPLRQMVPAQRSTVVHQAQPVRPAARPVAGTSAPATAVQQATTTTAAPATQLNILGLGNGFSGFTVTSAPPDPAIAVGPHHIVEIVNSDIAVLNKSGTTLYGPVATNTLFSGFGGGCQTNNDGDGVVRYDPIADRFLITQFSVTGANGTSVPFLECVAVSATPDPTGIYYRYSFPYSGFPDYPKLGVWPDGYYVTFNMFNPSATVFLGAKACAYDRASMLVGSPATQQCFDTTTTYGGLLPADLQGQRQPPVGSPSYVVGPGATTTSLASWKFHVDWATPGNSSFAGPTALPVAAYTPACGSTGTCIPQAGTSQQLDSLSDRLMFPLQYRNLGDHEALVVTHSVTVGSSVGVRWYELRPNAAHDLSVFQQGTYAPDATFRWMSSASMDQAGGIALGYSASSSSISPGVRFTGRLAGDLLGQMTQGEGTIVVGTGSQTGPNLSRWGDYTSMTVDPLDDCTFHYVNEYLQTNGAFNWSTRIASFRLPACGAPTLTSLAVSPSPVSLAKGTSTPLKAIGTYSDGSTADVTTAATWSSGDSTIATVSNTTGSQGQLTAVGQGGPVTITAKVGTTSASTLATVTAPVVVALRVSPASTTIGAKSTVQLHATLVYSDGTTVDATTSALWTTSSSTVAVVSSSGVVKGLHVGVATVTAQSRGFAGNCQVNVVKRSGT